MHGSPCTQTPVRSFWLTDALKPAVKKCKGLDLFLQSQLPFFVSSREASFQGDPVAFISQVLVEFARTRAGHRGHERRDVPAVLGALTG